MEMLLHFRKPGVSSDGRKGRVSLFFSSLQEALEKHLAGPNERGKKNPPLNIDAFLYSVLW